MFLAYGEETEIVRYVGSLPVPTTTTAQTQADDGVPDTSAIEQMFRVKRGINVR